MSQFSSSPAPSGSSSSSRIELRTLGETGLRGPPDRSALEEIVRQPKRLALLAYLAAATPASRHRRDHLVALLWPVMEPDRARAALRRALYFLRQRLGEGVIEGKGADEVGVDRSRLWCDAEALERRSAAGRYADALELYRGHLLPGLRVEGARGFEAWLDRRRRNLRETASGAAVALAARARSSGRGAQEMKLLERALEISPEREPVLRDLLRALVRAGDRGRALATYREWRRRQERALRLSPSPETRELADRIRADDAIPETEVETGWEEPDSRRGTGPTGRRDDPALVSPRRTAARELAERARDLADRGPARNLAARELADEAIRLDGESASARAARALTGAHAVQLYGARRQVLGDALDDVRGALSLAPHMPEAHFARGVLLETAGRLNPATTSFRRAVEFSEDDPEFAGHLGRVLMLRGEFGRSLAWTRRRAEREPSAPHLRLQLGLDLWCLERGDEAEELYRQVSEQRADLVWLGASWSFFELTRGHFDRARRKAEEMLDEHPEGFAGRFAAGDAALLTHDYEEALRHYEHCYRLDPDSRHPGTHRSSRLALGFAHLRAGQPEVGRQLVEAAEREARRLLAGGADYGGLWLDLAAARAALDRKERALEALEEAATAGWRQPGFSRHDPMFDALRSDDRFRRILRFMEEDVREQREAVE